MLLTHVSDWLLEIHDGPFFELVLKGITGTLARHSLLELVIRCRLSGMIWRDAR
jgi:hypothetical protein